MNSNGLNFIEIAEEINAHFSYREISKMTDEQKKLYIEKLEHFKRVNSSACTTTEKGESLEDLVTYLLEIYDRYFDVVNSVRTGTNEIDQFISSKQFMKMLISYGLIDARLESFLCECKNYSKKVDVTYVGKFASLLLTSSKKLGILFSYKGITGSKWSDASGLVKKFYLSKENVEARYCIIDFNISDFELVKNGVPFFEIIHSKIESLQMDTTFATYISQHPAELKL
ncbi:acetylglutamate semialdehyde dehydrogenase [Proteiniclasticum sp. C24MP]|uniref:acetylglutamate semialdehyde dehydrogenase n=1 Tax=Proteiniclasticum sp. C24MP TaxID=3374101 RepID=UPI003754EABB